MNVIVWLLAIVIAVPLIIAMLRFILLRSRGAQIVLRRLPAGDAEHWRHGILIYRQDHGYFFKLRSLRLGPDIVFDRSHIEVTAHRKPTAFELTLIPDMPDVLVAKANNKPFEAAMGYHEEMAFTSWVETAPDLRRERLDHKALVRRVRRHDNV